MEITFYPNVFADDNASWSALSRFLVERVSLLRFVSASFDFLDRLSFLNGVDDGVHELAIFALTV